MKQLTKNLLKMNFQGISLADVDKVEFAFSQKIGESPLKTAVYPDDEDVVKLTDTQLGVVFSMNDTALFKAGEYFYADTRVTMSDTAYQPATPIMKLRMEETLFENG